MIPKSLPALSTFLGQWWCLGEPLTSGVWGPYGDGIKPRVSWVKTCAVLLISISIDLRHFPAKVKKLTQEKKVICSRSYEEFGEKQSPQSGSWRPRAAAAAALTAALRLDCRQEPRMNSAKTLPMVSVHHVRLSYVLSLNCHILLLSQEGQISYPWKWSNEGWLVLNKPLGSESL